MESLPLWGQGILIALKLIAMFFWISIAICLPMAPMRLFEDHKHKHLWLYTVVFIPVLGAIWYCAWRFRIQSRQAEEIENSRIQAMAEAYRECAE